MIGNSPIDYAAVRISIASFRAIAPASTGYLAFCALQPQWFYLPLAFIAVLEAAFYLLVYLPRRRRLQAPPEQPPPRLTYAQRQALFDRCIDAESHGASTNLPYPSGWFLPATATPRKEDVIDWLLWALFATSREQTNIAEYEEELDGYIEGVEKLLGRSLEPGHSDTAEVRSMRITLDPVIMLHRPLLWYLIVGLVDTYTSIFLTYLGFKHYTPRDPQWRRTFPPRPVLHLLSRYAPDGVVTPYWFRPHRSNTKHPLVFFHGIGIGLYPYVPFLKSLISIDPDVGILLPEVMSICMHMTPRSVPPRAEMLASLNAILDSLQVEKNLDAQTPLLNEFHTANHGWDSVVLSAHSYGTFIAGWIIRECTMTDRSGLGTKIAHLVLVDPIPILLSNPTVAHNFLYREPNAVCPHRLGSVSDVDTDNTATTPVKQARYSSPAAWQLWYFASRDADIAHTLFRSFFWSEGGIWREDIDAWMEGESEGAQRRRNIAVFLGGKDQVVPSEAIRRYLTGDSTWSPRWCGTGTLRSVERAEEERAEILEVRDIVTRGPKSPDSGYRNTSVTGSADTLVCPRPSEAGGGKLEVLFNPVLDHAVIFDRPQWTGALIEVVRRYTRE